MNKDTEEILERGREMYVEIFKSEFSDQVLTLLGEKGVLDNTIFAMFYDATQEGYIADISDVMGSLDETPTYAVSAMRLRSLLCAAVTIGMYHQKVTNTLDSMWTKGVDKNPESE
jgi:hypothetical protein